MLSVAPIAMQSIGNSVWRASAVCGVAALLAQVGHGCVRGSSTHERRPRGGAWAGLLALGWTTAALNRKRARASGVWKLLQVWMGQGVGGTKLGTLHALPWSVFVLGLDVCDAWMSSMHDGGGLYGVVGVVVADVVAAFSVCASIVVLT